MSQPAARSDARANRARVLASAITVFAERGTDAEMREIADRARVAVGTVYNHFPSKDDLIVAVLAKARREFDAGLDDAFAEADPLRAMRAFVVMALAIVERYGELMTALQEGRATVAPDVDLTRARRAAFQERVAALVQRGVQAGMLRADLDPYVAGAVLRSAFTPWTFAELRRVRTPDQIADALMAIFLDGARP